MSDQGTEGLLSPFLKDQRIKKSVNISRDESLIMAVVQEIWDNIVIQIHI